MPGFLLYSVVAGLSLESKSFLCVRISDFNSELKNKIIAKRLKNVLLKIINPDQIGYIRKRYSGENVRLNSNVMASTEETNIPGIALFSGYKKFFDTIAWNSLTNYLKHIQLRTVHSKLVEIFIPCSSREQCLLLSSKQWLWWIRVFLLRTRC